MSNFLSQHPDGELDILSFAGKDASAEFDMFHPRDFIGKYAPDAVIGTTWTSGGSGSAHASHVSTVAQVASSGVAGRRSKDCEKVNKNRRDRLDGYRKVSIPVIEPFIHMVSAFMKGGQEPRTKTAMSTKCCGRGWECRHGTLSSACMYTSSLHNAHLSSELHRT